MSLSIVFGMPITEILEPPARISLLMAWAAFMVPSPPIMNSIFTLLLACQLFHPVAAGPREEPSIVPPKRWMSATFAGKLNGIMAEFGR